MRKILLGIIACIFITSSAYGAELNFTNNYNLGVPEYGYPDYHTPINANFVSVDSILKMISTDIVLVVPPSLSIISNDVGDLKVKTTILSNDAVDWESTVTKANILSNDAIDWEATVLKTDIISSDTVSQDALLSFLSEDSGIKFAILSNDASFTKSGTNVFLITSTNNVGIGTSSPLTKLEVIGQISGDALRFDIQATSPDVATLKGPALYVHSGGGLRYYDSSVWGDVGTAGAGAGVQSVTEGVAGPLVVAPNAPDVFISIQSADATTPGYVSTTNFNTWTNDRVSGDAVKTVVEGVAGPLEIVPSAGYQDVKISIQSADATTAGYVSIANFGTWTNDRVSTDAVLASLKMPSITAKVISADATGTFTGVSITTGKVSQIVNVISSDVLTGNIILPCDSTIPQITEGNEYMTLAITPTSAANKLKIDVVANVASGAAGRIVVALFQDATANALAAVANYNEANFLYNIKLTHYMTAGTTSATTFRVRIGNKNEGTTTFNGESAAGIFNGVMASSITITEYSS